MLADEGIGEWGFSALVEVDGHTFLFDTGARPDTVLKNAQELKIDLSKVEDVVISHNHGDHTGGLLTLRRELAIKNPKALSRIHAARGAFFPRPSPSGEMNRLLTDRAAYEASGGTVVENEGPVELVPGVWLTGPVPRAHPERNWSTLGKVQTPAGLVEDTVPEDQSLVFETGEGLILLSGCGHAGVVNTLEHARKTVRDAPVYAAIGGFHLFALDDKSLDWTFDHMKKEGVRQLMGAHCTGLEAVYRYRQHAGLDRQSCVVGAVGASYVLGKGIDPGRLAR